MFSTLISVAELQQQISGNPELVIFDCRFNLMDTGQGFTQYREAHIPGALYLHLDNDLSSPISSDSGRHPLPDMAVLTQRLCQGGVSDTSQVVVYDDCGGAMAARAWWLIKQLGHNAVALLDGGFPAWLAVADTVSDIPTVSPGSLIAEIDQQMYLPLAEVADYPVTGLLVDARSPERYRGEQEPIDPVAGHIPGAKNRPLQLNLTESGTFKPITELKAEWLDFLGDYRPEQVVHYCGSGVTACHNMLAMEHAGLTGSRIYAGSWSEWIRNPTRAVATGEES